MRAKSGFTILEIVIAMAILAIALLALMSGVVSSMRVDQATREQALAKAAASAKVEEMRRTTFVQIWACYNSTTSDDPVGVTSPGDTFSVTGLAPLPTGAPDNPPFDPEGDGIVGKIYWPEVSSNLSEGFVDSRMGITAARDLNGDGDTDDTNVNTTYGILPVRIVLEWRGVLGHSRYEITTFFAP